MIVSAKPILKKDGSLMLYLNNDQGISVVINDKVPMPALSKGQHELIAAFFTILNYEISNKFESVCEFRGNFNSHNEPKARLDFDLDLYITDIANVAGQKVSEDGLYLQYKGHLIKWDSSFGYALTDTI